jgi:hypothetical protein
MKFYSMAQSLDSFVRVGQELVDDFIGRNDYIGARDVIERNLMPTIMGLKLAGRIIPVRSQYAVVLAYCGALDEADAEMTRLAPYESGLDTRGQWELQNQRALIAHLRNNPPPPQWQMPTQLGASFGVARTRSTAARSSRSPSGFCSGTSCGSSYATFPLVAPVAPRLGQGLPQPTPPGKSRPSASD